MATIESLFPLVRMHVRNCHDPALEDAFRRIAREFCMETQWLRETIVRDVVGEQEIYDLEPDMEETEVIGLHAAQISDQLPLTPEAFEESQSANGGDASNWSWTQPNRLWLNPVPYDDIEDGILARVILQPTVDATTLPEELLRRNRETLADGTIAWLCSMSKSGWYDPDMVKLFLPKYENAKARRQLDSDNQFKPRNIRTTSYR